MSGLFVWLLCVVAGLGAAWIYFEDFELMRRRDRIASAVGKRSEFSELELRRAALETMFKIEYNYIKPTQED
jgi:hypothetical protein